MDICVCRFGAQVFRRFIHFSLFFFLSLSCVTQIYTLLFIYFTCFSFMSTAIFYMMHFVCVIFRINCSSLSFSLVRRAFVSIDAVWHYIDALSCCESESNDKNTQIVITKLHLKYVYLITDWLVCLLVLNNKTTAVEFRYLKFQVKWP